MTIIAIDGPSGSGKSSTSRLVAERLGLRYVDTGAMYRAMTWWMLEQGIDPKDASEVACRCSEPDIVVLDDPRSPGVLVNGQDVSLEIRGPKVSGAVSLVSAVPQVRQRLVALQRALVDVAHASGTGVVMEGRDIGSVVLPDADVKVFLTADADARARRRALEDAQRGDGTLQEEAVAQTHENLLARDALDSSRAVSPLVMADGAVHIDGTFLALDEVVDHVVACIPGKTG